MTLPWGRQRIVDPAERPEVEAIKATIAHTPTCQCQDKTPQVLETTRVVREDGTVVYEVILP